MNFRVGFLWKSNEKEIGILGNVFMHLDKGRIDGIRNAPVDPKQMAFFKSMHLGSLGKHVKLGHDDWILKFQGSLCATTQPSDRLGPIRINPNLLDGFLGWMLAKVFDRFFDKVRIGFFPTSKDKFFQSRVAENLQRHIKLQELIKGFEIMTPRSLPLSIEFMSRQIPKSRNIRHRHLSIAPLQIAFISNLFQRRVTKNVQGFRHHFFSRAVHVFHEQIHVKAFDFVQLFEVVFRYKSLQSFDALGCALLQEVQNSFRYFDLQDAAPNSKDCHPSIKDLFVRLGHFLQCGSGAVGHGIQEIKNHMHANFVGVLENAKHFAAGHSLQTLVQPSNSQEASAIVEKEDLPLVRGLGWSSFV
jgi:hypothetical protein